MDSPRYSPSVGADALYGAWLDAALLHLTSLQPAYAALLLQGSAATGDAWAVRDDDGALRLFSDPIVDPLLHIAMRPP